MKKAIFILFVAMLSAAACNSALKTVDPTGKGPIPKGVKESQRDTSVTGRDTTVKN